jgi:hypothetical protein
MSKETKKKINVLGGGADFIRNQTIAHETDFLCPLTTYACHFTVDKVLRLISRQFQLLPSVFTPLPLFLHCNLFSLNLQFL